MLGLIKALARAKTDEERQKIFADHFPHDPSLFPKGPKTLTVEGHAIELSWEYGGIPCYDAGPHRTLCLTDDGWVKPTTGHVMLGEVLDTQPDELFLQLAAGVFKTHYGCYPDLIRLFHHKYGSGGGFMWRPGGGADKWGALMEKGE